MCIICIKKVGVLYPTVATVKTMCENNPHGFTMVLADKGKPHIYKTLDMKKFIEHYKRTIEVHDYRTTSMYIHTRIKTHGTQRIENCHGWKENGLIFAHNGILSIANRGDLTDSETYFRDIFSPVYRAGGWKMAEKTINAVIGSSKFVFMDTQGDIRHYGHYIEDDGLLYSNTSYLDYSRFSRPTLGFKSSKWGGFQRTISTQKDWEDALFSEDYPF